MFYVITSLRTERFETKEAASLFIDLHCSAFGKEKLVKTNAIN